MFKTRIEAGRLLGKKLIDELTNSQIANFKDSVVVLGIPRGGVVVASQVARVLGCSLDVIVVKKLGAPYQSELAVGAVGETNGSQYLDDRLVKDLQIGKQYLDEEITRKKAEIKRREQLYRQGKPPLDLKDKLVIIVDDGAATGATIIAACREAWNNLPKKVIIGLPVIAKDTLEKLEEEADEVIYLDAPWDFYAVGQFYEDFPQVEDKEVVEILKSKTN
ncbi:hypothetical protein A3J78_00700 [Candidatus Beckwithbacteria bacterium RBG_13_35_6]|uniref:Phosphoribosyltransferase domain-containing protein n=1 Tax=Candidatus Beckwithbacteria bacterium RBG_13_35_6 TaxID=1797456 RepID=A0A1F5DFJ5_9BACT|nr:MAG: hypothetical protein A3J78_00700 [Candidatus Beckwithbacteria bacterium RBG_13_35_6]